MTDEMREILEYCGEADILKSVYWDLADREPCDAVSELESDNGYLANLERMLATKLPNRYSKKELKGYAGEYHKEFIRILREVDTKEYSEENIQLLITSVYNYFGEYIFYSKDLVRVFGVLKKELEVKTREDFVAITVINSVLSSRGIQEQVRKNDIRLIKENSRFKEAVLNWDVKCYVDFDAEVDFQVFGSYAKMSYGEDSLGMISTIYRDNGYERYLRLVTDKDVTKGKTEAIEELRRMYPNKFEDEDNDWIIDLDDHYFSWRDAIMLIPKEDDIMGIPKDYEERGIKKIRSHSKEIILSWIVYNNLHEIFH